ncbi:uncharacterized protein FTOL_12805 [Fusarium torulosum]|uniref:Uncharacterized protein n=1 Tax=Fusarium torulosum TaxID=33205 RepID=A0AAE8MLE8_9HYPO|nr:uncharacterized protein FTOL_12805 [Fusarium torulosum]
MKNDFPSVNLVIFGGEEAPLVAKELAASNIPLILSENQPSPDTFRSKDTAIGPPLTRYVASYLSEAGVKYGLSVAENSFIGSFRIHDLGPEAGWTAKFAHHDENEAIRLITSNIETILGLAPSRDLVVFEGNPL